METGRLVGDMETGQATWKGEGWGQATWNGQVGRYGKGAGDMEVKGEYNMERDVGRHGNRAGEGDMEVKGARSMKRGG